MQLTDEQADRIDNAIENTMSSHEATEDESGWPVCTCGARDNMDGDVLFTHRICVVMDAVRETIESF